MLRKRDREISRPQEHIRPVDFVYRRRISAARALAADVKGRDTDGWDTLRFSHGFGWSLIRWGYGVASTVAL